MAIIANWKIRSRAKKCSHTERKFEDGERFYTCITADPESDGYLRNDYCEAAWEELKPHEVDPEPFSYWRSTFEFPEPVEVDPSKQMDKDNAELLLQQLMDADDPRTDKARYVLVVMLERKKLLKQVGEKQVEERRLLIYEHTKSGEVFIVTDPQIKLEEVPAVQEEVVSLLDDMAQAESEVDDENEEEDESDQTESDEEAESGKGDGDEESEESADSGDNETKTEEAGDEEE